MIEAQRAILHIDMDAFYASVEQHDNPELKGLPVIVGGTGGRGVVAAASYEVRRYGVHSAMPMSTALRLCPEAVCIRPRMARYQAVSRQVFAIFHDFTPLVEGLSLDEAFLDITGSLRLLGPPERIALEIKDRIFEVTGLTASVGLAANKMLAKLASDMKKPNGFVCIEPHAVLTVLEPLPIECLSGVGRKTLMRLQAMGIHRFGDLQRASDAQLWPLFGRYSQRMRERAAGIDERPVVADGVEKSISAEETFERDLRDDAQLELKLVELADRACSRLRAKQLLAGQVHLKIRRADFTTYSRQKSFTPHTQDSRVVMKFARELLEAWRRAQPRAAVRLLGVGVGDLMPARQQDLFAESAAAQNPLDLTIDAIREKFGRAAVRRGLSR